MADRLGIAVVHAGLEIVFQPFAHGVGGQPDDENLHVTLGAGFTLKRGFYSFSLDAVADIHDYGEDYSGTASFKF